MAVKYALGYQNYEDMMRNHIFYIDKTDFIREWWENADKVTLVTRPRRFGKTLNMSTVECFLSNRYEGRSGLFEGRKVWEDEGMRGLQGTYPVIFMTFAGVKSVHGGQGGAAGARRAEEMKTAVKKIIARAYGEYVDIMKSDLFCGKEREYYASVGKEMPDETAATAISMLSSYLERYYGKKVVILLDEYDTPMQEAWLCGYWEEAVDFFRSFFVNTFKDNGSMERGLITGITRISKESIFSELNHLKVVTATSDKYAVSFGFTEEEVFRALEEAGLGEHKGGVKAWYDGFTFGSHRDIYNPWSIISFMENNAKYEAYWANTSSSGLVSRLIRTGGADMKSTVEDLLEADRTEEAGYTLALTNREVLFLFRKMVRGWFGKEDVPAYCNEFIRALLRDDVKRMNTFMNKVALETFSSFDTGRKPSGVSHPERFYHGFVLGLSVNLSDRYRLTSNRESGYGRYDVMLRPYEKKGEGVPFRIQGAG